MKSLVDENTFLGEREIIKLIQKHLTIMPDLPVPFGDDVSAVPFGSEGEVAVLKTDMLIGSTDVPDGMSLFSAARKAIVMNISDFASKGVLPSAAIVALGLPKKLANEKAVNEIAEGLNTGAREYGCFIIGGDTGETSDLTIAVSLFGTAKQRSLMLRTGTRAGDVLAVTGMFGKTAAGLHLLKNKCKSSPNIREVLLDAVFNPKAHLKEGLALKGYDYVSASMDSSDGLAWSLHELSRKNKVGFLLDRVPVALEAEKFAVDNQLDPFNLALYGGEEYELVLTIKPEKWSEAQALIEAVGGKLIPIGHAVYERRVVYEAAGERRIVQPRGYEHFKD